MVHGRNYHCKFYFQQYLNYIVAVANKYKSANKLAIASTKYNFKYINVVR